MCVPAILLGLGPFSKIFVLLSSSKDGNIVQKKKKPILYLRQLRQIATGKLLLLFMEEFLTRACEGAGCIRLGVLRDIKERLASTQMLIARLMRTDSVSTQRAEPSCPFSSLPAGTAFLEWFLPTSYPLCP